MTEKTNADKLSPLQKKMLDMLRQMLAKGIDITHKNLSKVMPGHSMRDYSAALESFNEERAFANKWADSMPDEVGAYAGLLASMAWSHAKAQFSKIMADTERHHHSELDMLRVSRDESEKDKHSPRPLCSLRHAPFVGRPGLTGYPETLPMGTVSVPETPLFQCL